MRYVLVVEVDLKRDEAETKKSMMPGGGDDEQARLAVVVDVERDGATRK